jgi:hypothetical protein
VRRVGEVQYGVVWVRSVWEGKVQCGEGAVWRG